MKRMLFVYNPNSGMGLLKPKLSDVIDTFVKGGYEVTVYPTQRSQDAVRKVSEYKEEYDLVACSGGDGTLDEVVTGMMMRENKTPIGYIPAGTTNDSVSFHDIWQLSFSAVHNYDFPVRILTTFAVPSPVFFHFF